MAVSVVMFVTALTFIAAPAQAQVSDTLLLTELVVTPTGGEFVEIHNPTGAAVDLSDVYLTDATFSGDATYYYNIVTGTNAGGGGFGDFHARFPDGASIAAGAYATVSMSGAASYVIEYGVLPDYELFDTDAGVADMLEATPGSIGGQGGLTNGGEFVVLYSWDGVSDLVADLDYAVWGDKDEAVDKTGISLDGPDADAVASPYLADTAIAAQDVVSTGAHASGMSWQRADLDEGNETKTGGNGLTGHDETSEDLSETWCESAPTPGAAGACVAPPTGSDIVVNEIHADPAADLPGDANGDGVRDSSDDEFVEIVNTSGAPLDLSGWTISDSVSVRHTFPTTIVAPDCTVLVFGGGTPTGTFGSAVVQTASTGALGLNNSGDSVIVARPDTTVEASEAYGAEGGNDQSLTLDPDVTGLAYVLHTGATGSAGAAYSPGTLIDGSSFSGCEVSLTLIHDVQGPGSASPLDGSTVLVEAVVVAIFEDGFFVQEEDVDADADGSTSEGIYVFNPAAPVAVGDLVQVTGTVDEFFDLTEITNVTDITVVSSGNALPTAAVVDLPMSSETALEVVEGMLVVFPETLTVTDNFNWHRYGEVGLSADGRQFSPTNIIAPGPAAGDADGDAIADINELGRITLDDGSSAQFPPVPPYINTEGTLRLGDSVTGLIGVMDYAFGLYRIQPAGPITFDSTNPRPAAVTDFGDDLVVATVNTLNYWTTIDDGSNDARGADSAAEFVRQQDKLVQLILGLDANIVGLQELENNGDVAISALTDALNVATAPGTWAFAPEPAYPGGLQSTNAIRSGIIYQPAVVSPVGVSIADPDPIFAEDRPPIAQTFDANGSVFTVIVNHYKSKGCSDSAGLDVDQNDGQACYNERRTLMSERMLDFVAELQVSTEDPDVIVLGDLNSYANEDPIVALEAGLTNQVDAFIADPFDQYSFNFFGQSGLLDYVFTTPSLDASVTGLEIWHVNTDEPRALSYNDEIIDPAENSSNLEQDILYQADQFRSSDHDPVRMALSLVTNTAPDCSAAVPSRTRLWRPTHRLRSVTVQGVTDADGDTVTITIDSIFQDEVLNGPGDGNTNIDGFGVGTDTARLRAERAGGGNGRVYTVSYTADDGNGGTCSGVVTVGVPLSRFGTVINDGALYDSTGGTPG